MTTQDANSSNGSSGNTASFSFTNGRRYHNEPNCPYPLPNDLNEIDRLDLQHYAVQQVTHKRYHAPLDNPRRSLDIGAGTGVWLMEMATDFPECEFTGVDIAPLQPTTVLPSNCTFEIGNALEGLSHPDGYFDYVRHSLLVAAIPKDKWQPYVKECARLCASGGWVEMTEFNCKVQAGGPAMAKLSELLSVLDKLMHEAGLVDIKVSEFRLPLGSWGGAAGVLFKKDSRLLQTTLAPLYVKLHGMTLEETEKLIQESEDEMESRQAYATLRVFVGRKP
ncbi:methyltransferase type 11 [Thamnocephalis sphaerospora]|uniref:Methyltransferase type 11 n=1 Tax=Thamnocephalis sphaerospora TaxID=78915 RepID=A0A4P9XR42_9FUNG|nr:methyltransferase type 11 [Thamnocephalis sphaerospora]|eukprot:RKP07780.1 methyltransferase type 11 [Thamnocephalis sphaerospora]